MRKIFGFGLLLLFSLGFSSYAASAGAQTCPFTGVWQGVEQADAGIRIEFSAEGQYRLSVNGKKLTDQVESWGSVKYSWGKEKDRYLITIFGEKEPEATTQLEATFLENGLLQLQVFSDAGKFVSSILLKKV